MLQESQRVELKRELSDKLEKEIVAFLNSREGGVIYIGIDDDGSVIENLPLDDIQLKAADRIKNNILPATKVENLTRTKITSTTRIDKKLVDSVALREAVVNAIVHNDYSREIPPVVEIFSNRIEVTSFGGLISGQTQEEFFSGSSMPRNRELMRVFKDLGLVEQLGSGMNRILKAYDRNIFDISEHFIKVVFPFEQEPSACVRDSGRFTWYNIRKKIRRTN